MCQDWGNSFFDSLEKKREVIKVSSPFIVLIDDKTISVHFDICMDDKGIYLEHVALYTDSSILDEEYENLLDRVTSQVVTYCSNNLSLLSPVNVKKRSN